MSNFAGGDSFVFKDVAGKTTDWEDTLVKHGIIEENPANVARREADLACEEAVGELRSQRDNYDPLAHMGLRALERARNEDDAFADERRTIEAYRAKRLRELKAMQKKAAGGDDGGEEGGLEGAAGKAPAPQYTGGYRQIGRGDFLREVTEESAKGVWVVLHLFKDNNAECAALHRALGALAERHLHTRFLKIVGSQCIEGFPDANLPTMIVYHDGTCQAQMVACGKTFGGVKADEESVEWVLSELGAVQTDQSEDPRLPGQAGFQIRRHSPRRRQNKLSPSATVKRRAGFVPGADDSEEDDY
jgi:hypothetical protein